MVDRLGCHVVKHHLREMQQIVEYQQTMTIMTDENVNPASIQPVKRHLKALQRSWGIPFKEG